MKNYYAYIPTKAGQKPTGTANQRFINDLKTLRGVINRLERTSPWKDSSFIIQSYTNKYDESTYKTIYTNSI